MCKNNEEQYIANNNQNCLLAAINKKEVHLRVALWRQEARDGGGRGGTEAGDHPPPTLSTSPHSFPPQTPDTNSHKIRRGCSIREL